MRWVTAHGKALQIQEQGPERLGRFGDSRALDHLIQRRAVHELLFDARANHPLPLFPALSFVGRAEGADSKAGGRAVVWIEPDRLFYPPALCSHSLYLQQKQFYLLRPRPADVVWTAVECLRCPGVAAVIARVPQRLTRVEARRLQLAAEQGGGLGILVRPKPSPGMTDIYSAKTRWLISPSPGERTVQRWRVEMIHGHGWQTCQPFLLEKYRGSGETRSGETRFVPLVSRLADPALVSAAS